MVLIGATFYRVGHPWIVVSDPQHPSGKVLCVNLTTLDEECPDDECILDNSDYAWIEVNHPTAVAFSRARIWSVAKLDGCIQSGYLKRANPPVVPAATLAKIVSAAKISRELGANHKALL